MSDSKNPPPKEPLTPQEMEALQAQRGEQIDNQVAAPVDNGVDNAPPGLSGPALPDSGLPGSLQTTLPQDANAPPGFGGPDTGVGSAERDILTEYLVNNPDFTSEAAKQEVIEYIAAITGQTSAEQRAYLYNNYERVIADYTGIEGLEPPKALEAARQWWDNSWRTMAANDAKGELRRALEAGDAVRAERAAARIQAMEQNIANADVLSRNPFFNNWVKPAVENIAYSVVPLVKGATVGMGAAAGVGLAQSLLTAPLTGGASLVAPVATMALIGTAASAAGRAQASTEIMYNEMVWDMFQITDDEGNRLPPEMYLPIAGVASGLQGLVESVQIAQYFPGGKEIFAGALSRLTKRLYSTRFFQNAVVRALGRYGVNVTDEALEEFGQEVIGVIATNLAVDLANQAGGDFDRIGFQEAVERELQAFSQGFRASAILALPSNLVETGADVASRVTERRASGEAQTLRQEQAGKLNVPEQATPQREEPRPVAEVQAEIDEVAANFDIDPDSSARRMLELAAELQEAESTPQVTPQVEEGAADEIPVYQMTREQYRQHLERQAAAQSGEVAALSPAAQRFRSRVIESSLEAGAQVTEVEADIVARLFDERARARGIDSEQYLAEFDQRIAAPAAELHQELEGTPLPQDKSGFIDYTSEAKAIIGLTADSDVGTWIHELGHKWRDEISGEQKQIVDSYYGTDVAGEEAFTEDLTTYLMTGRSPSPELNSLFKQVAEFLKNVYRTIRGRAPVNESIAAVFDSLFTPAEQEFQAEFGEPASAVREVTVYDKALPEEAQVDEDWLQRAQDETATEAHVKRIVSDVLDDAFVNTGRGQRAPAELIEALGLTQEQADSLWQSRGETGEINAFDWIDIKENALANPEFWQNQDVRDWMNQNVAPVVNTQLNDLGSDSTIRFQNLPQSEASVVDSVMEAEAYGEEPSDPGHRSILYQTKPPHKGKKLKAWLESLPEQARATYQMLNGMVELGQQRANEAPLVMKMVLSEPWASKATDLRARIKEAKTDATRDRLKAELKEINDTGQREEKWVKPPNPFTQYMQPQAWNKLVAEQKWIAEAAKELYNQLPAEVRDAAGLMKNGKIRIKEMEKMFKMGRSITQRIIDSMPLEAAAPEYETAGKYIHTTAASSQMVVGGEAYRRALVAEYRRMFRDGELDTKNISGLSKDTWGALGFLASNEKTGASGDFTTVCPQMYFNKGCWYCYRADALRTGVNNKLTAEKVWYAGEILQIHDKDIERMNRAGGLRIQSFGDWMPHFAPMLADMLIDAEMRGLHIKIITKEPSMITTLAKLKEQGIGVHNVYFNLSADYYTEGVPVEPGANWSEREWQPANPERPLFTNDDFENIPDGEIYWKRALSVAEANEIKQAHPWVKIRVVVSSADDFIRALRDERIDVITGYHGKIRKPSQVDRRLIHSETGAVISELDPLGDNGMPRFNPDGSIEYAGKLKVHKKLAQRIVEEGLQKEYWIKSCCITGKCHLCATRCGVQNFAPETQQSLKEAGELPEAIRYWREYKRSLDEKGARYESRTDTPEFRAWFGDSKVVDENGDPLVVYHGTDVDFEAFERGRAGAMYFTADREYASQYGERVLPVFLQVEKLADLTNPTSPAYQMAVRRFNETGGWAANADTWDYLQEQGRTDPMFNPAEDLTWEIFDMPESGVDQVLLEAGYDGVKLEERRGVDTYAVFKPTQVKAVNNRGTWSRDDSRILYADTRPQAEEPGPHERSVNEAVDAGWWVPDEVLDEYADREWAKTERERRIRLREEARQSIEAQESADEFVQMQTVMDGDATPEYYRELYNSAAGIAPPTPDQIAAEWAESLDKTTLASYLKYIAARGWADQLPHKVVAAITKKIGPYGNLTDEQFTKIMDQIRARRIDWYETLAALTENDDDLRFMEEAMKAHPEESRMRKLENQIDKLRQTNDRLNRNIEGLDHQIELDRKYERDLTGRIADLEEEIAREKKHFKETVQTVVGAEREIAREEQKEALIAERKRVRKQIRETREAREYVKRLLKEIMRRPGATIEYHYAQRIIEIQDGYDPRSFRRGNIGKVRNMLKNSMPNITDEQLREILEKELGKTSLRDMNLPALESAHKEIQALREAGRQALFEKVEARKAQDLADVTDLITNIGGSSFLMNLGTERSERELKSSALNKGKFAIWNMKRITDMLGPKWKEIFDLEVNRLTDEQRRQKWRKIERYKMLQRKTGVRTKQLQEKVNDDLTVNEALAVWIYLQNEDSAAALRNGNLLSAKNLGEARRYVESDPALLEFANGLMDLFDDESFERLQEVFIEYSNTAMERVERYFPMRRQQIGNTTFDQEVADDLLSRTYAGKTYAWRGFTHSRKHVRRTGQPPLRLDAVNVALENVEKQEHFAAMAMHVKRMQRLLSNESVREAFVGKFGREAYQIMEEYVNRVANPSIHRATTMISKFMQSLRGNMTLGALMFNLMSPIKNLVGPLLYLPYISKNPVEAAYRLTTSMVRVIIDKAARDALYEANPQLRDRSLDPSIREAHEINRIGHRKLKMFIEKWGMKPLEIVDQWTVLAGEDAVYRAKLAELGHEGAVAAAQDATLRSQPFGNEKDTPSLYTDPTARMFLMFTSPLNQIFGMVTNDLPHMVKNGGAGTVSLMVIALVMTGILLRSMERKRPPEDGEELAKDIASQWIEMLPFVGTEIMGAVDGSPFAGRGLSVTGFAVDTYRGVQRLFDDEADARQKWDGMMRAATNTMRMVGLPGVAVNRAYKMFVSDAQRIDPWALVGGPPEERSNVNQ